MSKRRKAGDLVWKLPNAGFLGFPCFGILEAEEDRESCCLSCGDPECTGWSNVAVFKPDGTPAGHVYHVYECQMEDPEIPDEEAVCARCGAPSTHKHADGACYCDACCEVEAHGDAKT